jgi:hypothetical protein
MHMQPPSAEAMEKAIKLGHEPSTVSIKGVIWFLIGLVLTMAATFAFIWVVWHFLTIQQRESDAPNTSLAVVNQVPQGPPLQPSIVHDHVEHEDLDAMHDRENQQFSKMGWTLSDGRVRVSDNIASQVIQLTKEKGPATAPTYNGWATPVISQPGISQ